jgi:DNA-binding CsgD family transcriptional regulator
MIRVLSGSRLVQESLALALGDLLLHRAVVLVADYPLGSALALLSGVQGPCVVKTASTSPFYLSDLVALGPAGLVLESAGLEFLKWTLQQVSEGQRVLPRLKEVTLTRKERAVLRLLVAGVCNDGIASHLGISPRRAANLVSTVKQALGAETRADVVLRYFGMTPAPNIKTTLQKTGNFSLPLEGETA